MRKREITRAEALELVKKDALNLKAVSPYNSDEEIVLTAVKLNYEAMKYADRGLKKSKDFALKLINEDIVDALEFCSSDIKDNLEIEILALAKSFTAIGALGIYRVVKVLRYVKAKIESKKLMQQYSEIYQFVCTTLSDPRNLNHKYMLYNHYPLIKSFKLAKALLEEDIKNNKFEDGEIIIKFKAKDKKTKTLSFLRKGKKEKNDEQSR